MADFSGGPGVSVGDLLRLPAFASVQVVAGEQGLDRVVSRANIMEVPDIVPWVKPHELLLTTGYPLREVPQGLAYLVDALDHAGVAALGVKLRRYLDHLPADMLAAADRCGLPVLLLPDDVAFDELLNPVLADVLNRQSTILERSELVHRALVSVVLDGGELAELVAELNALMGDLTFVTTTDGRVLAQAGDEAAQVALRGTEVFEPLGRFRTERFPAGTHQVRPGPVSGGDAHAYSVAVTPVLAGTADHGRLVVVRRHQPPSACDLHVLERAATVAALVITKSLAVQAVEAKYRGDFVRDVLEGRAGSAESVVGHFTTLGWDVARPLVVVVGAHDPASPAVHRSSRQTTAAQLSAGSLTADRRTTDRGSADRARATQDRFANAWANVVRRHDKTAPVVGFAQEVVALIAVPTGRSAREIVDGLVGAVSGDGGGGRIPFSTGVSRLVMDPSGIVGAYQQARRAVQVGRQLHGPSALAHFDDLGAFRLLSLIDDTAELRNFVVEVLGELADDENTQAADMRGTLRVLLDTNLNVAETSRRLHFHYNTLRYRISKLERIVGPFTDDPDLRLDLSLALRVISMRGL